MTDNKQGLKSRHRAIGFAIIANNNDFVVIDKHPGVNFHSEDNQPGVVVAVEQMLAQKLYSVHRLDKMTSGLLLLAKSSQVASELSTLFSTRQIDKFYLAISDKKPKKSQGLIKGGMEKSRRAMWKLTRGKDNFAMTQFFSYGLGNGKRLFVVKPLTGKTHQIRVALKSLGSAICGDPTYASETADQFDRGYLHAYLLKFNLAGEQYSFSSYPNSGELFLQDNCIEKLKSLGDVSLLKWPKVTA